MFLLRRSTAPTPPSRRPSKPPDSQVVSPVPEPKSRLGDPECESLRDELSQTNDFSSKETVKLRDLSAYLREYAVHLAIDADFVGARNAQALGERVHAELVRRATKVDTRADLQATTRDHEQSRRATWDQRVRDFESEADQARSELLEKHESERVEFEATWQNAKPREYARPPGTLLQLKQIERFLAASGQIDHAEHIHAEAQRCASAAAVVAKQRLDRDYLFALERLLDRQRGEIARFEAHTVHRRKLLESERVRSDARGKCRLSVVGSVCVRAARPRIGEECRALPAKMPRAGRLSGVLLPGLLPPNVPERIRYRMESNNASRRSSSEATAGAREAADLAVSEKVVKGDALDGASDHVSGRQSARDGAAQGEDPPPDGAGEGLAGERVFQTMLDPDTMPPEQVDQAADEIEGHEGDVQAE
jgi:hypothetical protein